MMLVDDWQTIAKKAWSMRLSLLAAAFAAAEVALPFFSDFIPPQTMAILATVTAAGAAIARIVAQPSMHDHGTQAEK